MPLSDLVTQRLTTLHGRWLELKDRYPQVFHCCARQDGPVRLYEQPNDPGRSAYELGNVAADVYCSRFLRAEDDADSQFQFEPSHRRFEFRRSLHVALWRMASLRSVTSQDTVWSNLHSDDAASPIVLPGQEGRWFGACVFEKRWEDPDVSSRTSDWYEEAGRLASESMVSFDIRVAPVRDHLRLLESWLAKVYDLLGFEVRSRTVSTTCVDLTGADFTGGRRDHYLVGISKSSRPSADVASSLTWLDCDLATASAKAIELLVNSGPSHAEKTGITRQGAPADSHPDDRPKTKRKPGNRNVDATKEELIKRVLVNHHIRDDETIDRSPLTTRKIEELSENIVSDSTAGRFIKREFGSIRDYRRICQIGVIEVHVRSWTDGLRSLGTLDTSLLSETLDSSGQIMRSHRRSKPVDDD